MVSDTLRDKQNALLGHMVAEYFLLNQNATPIVKESCTLTEKETPSSAVSPRQIETGTRKVRTDNRMRNVIVQPKGKQVV